MLWSADKHFPLSNAYVLSTSPLFLIQNLLRFNELVHSSICTRVKHSIMDEMKQLSKALMQRKSFKDRQECLSESLDHLSFDYPELYSLLFREMKRRELESNDPSKIIKWLKSTTTSDSYVKLHESLMLVKNHNLMAKEEYMENLKGMLYQTIDNGTNLKVALKICYLIEKSPHLTTINEKLMSLIQRVKQLNIKQHNRLKPLRSPKIDSFNHSELINSFDQLSIQQVNNVVQQQHKSIWPTMLQPMSTKYAHGGHFSPEYFGFNHLGTVASTNRFPAFNCLQLPLNITIVTQDMIVVVSRWLHYLKLHKYQWFFNELSYLEIEFIDEDNIEGFIAKVNRNSITKGAQKKICISTKALRDRQQKLKDLSLSLDLEVMPNELCEFMTYMRDILNYPIPNNNCVVGDKLQQDIIVVMEKFLNQLMEKLRATKSLVAHSLLGTSINKYLECILLITKNPMFSEYQVRKSEMFASTLKYKVHGMPTNHKLK